MDERLKLDRTWLCTVVFVDIARYSEQTVELQMAWKRRLNGYLAAAIQEVPETDRVILDTGDGAAICFLGDPEAAMFCALGLLGALNQDERRQEPPLRARIGINLGPAKLVRDINGNLNAIGDGVNVGQRVMSFAGENQVLVSRSYFEVVSCLSETYSHLFRFGGVRRDKHVREHTVYELQPPGAGGLPGSGPGEGPTPPDGQGATERNRPGGGASPADPEARARIEAALAAAIGPMAHYLVEKAGPVATSPEELGLVLARFVPGDEAQAAFRAACGIGAAPSGASGRTSRAGDREPEGAAMAARDPGKPTPGWATPASAPWDPALLEQARAALAHHVGPMARILVDRAAARARSGSELYALLAAEIPSPRDRSAFLRAAPPSDPKG